MKRKTKIILRADANEYIGAGHVFRLLALAEILREDFEIWFYTNTTDKFILSTILKYVDNLILIDKKINYCKPIDKCMTDEIEFDLDDNLDKSTIVVLDGYWFRELYQKMVKKTGAKLVMIDDFANQFFYSDVVINHSPGSSKINYAGQDFTKYFLGLDYVLIRSVFFDSLKNHKYQKKCNFFVSFGGSDTSQLSIKYALPLLIDKNNIVHILITDLFEINLINKLIKLKIKFNGRLFLHKNLNESQLKCLLDSCKYAIVPSSTIFLECLSRGVSCIIGYQTNNQINIYNGAIQERLAVGIGDMNKYNLSNVKKAILRVKRGNNHIMKLNSKRRIIKIFNNLTN